MTNLGTSTNPIEEIHANDIVTDKLNDISFDSVGRARFDKTSDPVFGTGGDATAEAIRNKYAYVQSSSDSGDNFLWIPRECLSYENGLAIALWVVKTQWYNTITGEYYNSMAIVPIPGFRDIPYDKRLVVGVVGRGEDESEGYNRTILTIKGSRGSNSEILEDDVFELEIFDIGDVIDNERKMKILSAYRLPMSFNHIIPKWTDDQG